MSSFKSLFLGGIIIQLFTFGTVFGQTFKKGNENFEKLDGKERLDGSPLKCLSNEWKCGSVCISKFELCGTDCYPGYFLNCAQRCIQFGLQYMCNNKCQTTKTTCNGQCPVNYFLNCQGVCTSFILESRYQRWLCNGQCQNWDKPCEGKCLHEELQINCNGECEKELSSFDCNNSCQSLDKPCNGRCLNASEWRCQNADKCIDLCSASSIELRQCPVEMRSRSLICSEKEASSVFFKDSRHSSEYHICSTEAQVIKSSQLCDGILNCIDRSDESNCQKFSSIQFQNIFENCIVNDINNYNNQTRRGSKGFKCGPDLCLDWDIWCNSVSLTKDPILDKTCPELLIQINNPQLCTNLTFWTNKTCNNGYGRCLGNRPGQCTKEKGRQSGITTRTVEITCHDKSEYSHTWNHPNCKRPYAVFCRNRDYCVHKDVVCDGHFNCADESDELPEVCDKCPRFFGYPPGRSRFATLSCKHRYTNRSICAVPCDGIDDLCEDFLDEQCHVSAAKYTSLFLLSLIIVTCLLGEFAFRFEMKQNNGDAIKLMAYPNSIFDLAMENGIHSSYKCAAEFCQIHESQMFSNEISAMISQARQHDNLNEKRMLAMSILQLECLYHGNCNIKALICLKKNLGTNETSKTFLSLLHPESDFEKLKNILINCVRKISNCLPKKLQVNIKYHLITICKITFYYADLIKDTFLLVLLYQKVSPLRPFSSFEFQLLFFTFLSVVLPQILNGMLLIGYIISKKVHLMSGILFATFSFTTPAVGMYIISMFRTCKEIITDLTTQLYLEQCIEKWKFRCSLLKMNETLIENTIQVSLLIFVVLLKYSNTKTVQGLENLITGNEAEYIAISAAWSLMSMVKGQTRWQTACKKSAISVKGELILLTYFFVSMITRTSAVLLYFAPSMGLLNLLSHWKMGSLKSSTAEIIYSVDEQGEETFFRKKWEELKQYSELTIFDLEIYFSVFLISIFIHFVLVMIVKCIFSLPSRKKGSFLLNIFHLLTQLHCPTLTHDWDEEVTLPRDARNNLNKVRVEMKALLALFTVEHILMCVPMWILSFNIYKRNIFLDNSFPQVLEEKTATSLAYTLAVICPLLYLFIPYLQFEIFNCYNLYGHPWSKLLHPENENVERKGETQMEETTSFNKEEIDRLEKELNLRDDEQNSVPSKQFSEDDKESAENKTAVRSRRSITNSLESCPEC